MKITTLLGATLLTALPLQLQGASSISLIFNESADGEASSDPLNPTDLGTLALGESGISGSVTSNDGAGGSNTALPTTRDFFTFNIAENQVLTGIFVSALSGTDAAGAPSNDPGFFLLDEGATSLIPGGGTSASFLTGALLSAETPFGTNLLELDNITGGPGITLPLEAGDFVFGIQQTGPETLNFTLGIQVEAVPEPSSALLLGLGSLLGLRRRRS